MNAYTAFKIAFISLPIERMKQYISARFTLKYSESFAVENNPVRLLIRNAKKQLAPLERVKARLYFHPSYLPSAISSPR